MNKWFGYQLQNGSFQAKRYFDSRDITEARESDFVFCVCEPFDAADRNDALKIIRERLA